MFVWSHWAEDGLCLVRTIVINGNCSMAEFVVRLSAGIIAVTIYSRHTSWQRKRSRYLSIDGVPPRHYTADMNISRVNADLVCQRAAEKALVAVV